MALLTACAFCHLPGEDPRRWKASCRDRSSSKIRRSLAHAFRHHICLRSLSGAITLIQRFCLVAKKKQCSSVPKGQRCVETDRKEESLDEKCKWLSETVRLV